jgi:prepilin-type N-terminal cleavage/methylation domain-containing protein
MRRGLTLIELVIVIAILAIAASIVYPLIFRQERPPEAPSEAALLEQAKLIAIARAEPMRLTVAQDGTWEIVAEGTPSSPLASGQLAEAPPASFVVRVTELGACLPVDNDRQGARGGAHVDAVSCTLRP